MSKKSKHQEFHFSFFVLIRWLIFALIFYFSVNYLSQNKSNLNTNLNSSSGLGSSLNLSSLNTQPVIIEASNQFNQYKNQAIVFINQQITDIKKQVVTEIYQNILMIFIKHNNNKIFFNNKQDKLRTFRTLIAFSLNSRLFSGENDNNIVPLMTKKNFFLIHFIFLIFI